MKQLTEEQFQNMRQRPPGPSSFARLMISNLKQGEAILLEPTDWKQKRSPSQLISRLKKKSGRDYTCGRSMDEPGWVIKRVK